MKAFFILIILLFFANPAWAFQCPQKSDKERYEESERAFLIYVTGTKLDEKLFKELSQAYAAEKGYAAENDDSESVKAIFADYEIIEEYKGDPAFKPKLVDFLGIGMGYVGLTPGKYYVVMLPPAEEASMRDIRAVNICNTLYEHYRLKVDGFQKQLDSIRALKEKAK